MGEVLLKAFSLVLIIVIAYVLKKMRLFQRDDYKIVSRIVMNVTLPCAIINGFKEFKMEKSLLGIIFVGLFLNLFMSAVGYIIALKKDESEKAFNVINLAGFNIGCFTMPFVQNFLGATGVGVTSLFDAGNSIMCTGGTNAIAMTIADRKKRFSIKDFLIKVFSSVPLDTYLIMFVLSLADIKFPDSVYVITNPIGSSNPFLSMFMIGLVFECSLQKDMIKKASYILIIRYGLAVLSAAVLFFMLPFSLEIRRIIVILVFAPMSVLSPVFTGNCKGDVSFSGVVNSLSIPISIAIIISLITYWQI